MALYTYVANKNPNDTQSRITFSTGKDILLSETIDLTAQEIIEVGRLSSRVDVRAGTIAAPISHLTFPPVRYYTRIGGVAVSKKPYQK